MDTIGERVQELVARFGAPVVCLAQARCDGHPSEAAAFVLIGEDLSPQTQTYGDLRSSSEQIAAEVVRLWTEYEQMPDLSTAVIV